VEAFKDGRSWQVGTTRDIDWIVNRTTEGTSITSAIPPVFEAYATFYEPDGVSVVAHERALVNRLIEFTPDQPWWLGYLDTGAHSVVFDDVPKVSLYWSWPTVPSPPPRTSFYLATGASEGNGVLPTCSFLSIDLAVRPPTTWTCIGGPRILIEALHHDPLVQAHRVQLGVDAKPPGRERDDDESNDEMSTEPNPRMPLWYRDT
jgi:hypothetical protein